MHGVVFNSRAGWKSTPYHTPIMIIHIIPVVIIVIITIIIIINIITNILLILPGVGHAWFGV
jgi:hypothetical protein